jgi:hypothetical protein
MRDNIISYQEMCANERMSLQRGMNFLGSTGYSILLMSVRENAPYNDQVLENGTVLIYEGHDVPTSVETPIPQMVDQTDRLPSGSLTENGKFFQAAIAAKDSAGEARFVRVYEKIRKGIWIDNGFFELTDAWVEESKNRRVFKFRLETTECGQDHLNTKLVHDENEVRPRIIPSAVKIEVWKRDGGKCIQCGSQNELHFDHIVPYSKGGSSLVASNIQLLCIRHNLAKSARIE